MRLDGFASVNAPYEGGEFLTKASRFEGGNLQLNCATSAAGSIRVEIQDADGKPLPDFTLQDCTEFFCNSIERAVSWKGGGDFSKLAGQSVRLRFGMKDADVFALQFIP